VFKELEKEGKSVKKLDYENDEVIDLDTVKFISAGDKEDR
jgi:hypothetical protein